VASRRAGGGRGRESGVDFIRADPVPDEDDMEGTQGTNGDRVVSYGSSVTNLTRDNEKQMSKAEVELIEGADEIAKKAHSINEAGVGERLDVYG
jgi:hypothetical protein